MEDYKVAKEAVWLAAEWQRLRSEFSSFPGKEFMSCSLFKRIGEPDPDRRYWTILFSGPQGSLERSQFSDLRHEKVGNFEQLSSRGGVLLEATWPGYAATKGSAVPWQFWYDELYGVPFRDIEWKPRVQRRDEIFESIYRNHLECSIENLMSRCISKCIEFESYALCDGFARMCNLPILPVANSTPSAWLTREMKFLGLDHNNMHIYGGPARKTVLSLVGGAKGTRDSWTSVCDAFSKRSKKPHTLNDIPGLDLLPKSPKKSRR